ncbi:MAG: hypothetical protein HGB18_04690 [Candidatus Moranbacteria bacterium]|nr:hypothetical protein [Candidatus Moranbacteria bacterium]
MNGTIRNARCGRRHGFLLIEAALVLFLFSVIVLTFYQLFALGSKRILDSRRKLGATALAAERMEMIRSLPYDVIGTKQPDGSGGFMYGIPPGDILETETVERSGSSFTVHTVAQYVDDPFDGTSSGSPTDVIPTDYKRVRVEVSWADAEAGQRVVAWASFSPDGVEQPSNTGVLSVNVLDPAADPVEGAVVHIVNASTGVNLSAETDAFGNQAWPGTPPGEGYSIAVSKSGYCGVRTYPPYPESAFDPLDSDIAVIAGSVNQKSFSIGRTADLTIRSENMAGNAIPDVAFTLSGGLQLGTEPPPAPPAPSTVPVPVYDFTSSSDTGSSGEKEYADRCPGSYEFSSVGSVPGMEFVGIDPVASAGSQAFNLDAGTDATVRLRFADLSLDSVLFTVTMTDSSSGTPNDVPVSGLSVRLRSATLGYDSTVATDGAGHAYFPTSSDPLAEGTYEYEVSGDGYGTETGSVDIDGSGLVRKAVTVNAS